MCDRPAAQRAERRIDCQLVHTYTGTRVNEWEVMTELQIPTAIVRLHFVLHDSVDDMSGPVCQMRKPQWFEKWSCTRGGRRQ